MASTLYQMINESSFFLFPGLELEYIQQFFIIGYGFFTLAGDISLHYAKNVQIILFYKSQYFALQIR